MIVETATEEDLDKPMKAKQLSDQGYQVIKFQEKFPRVTIFGVLSAVTSVELIDQIYEKNDYINKQYIKVQLQSRLKTVRSWTNLKTPAITNWVLEVHPEVRGIINEKGNTIRVEWSLLRVADLLDATRCFRCQEYGHVAKHCRRTQNTCGHCGKEGHVFRECPAASVDPICPPVSAKRRRL